MLNYYNKLSVGEEQYQESNEMLVLGYLENNKIGVSRLELICNATDRFLVSR
jgi:hypothetical protein